jgi:hypothetical protein
MAAGNSYSQHDPLGDRFWCAVEKPGGIAACCTARLRPIRREKFWSAGAIASKRLGGAYRMAIAEGAFVQPNGNRSGLA